MALLQKKSAEIRQSFLHDQALLMAEKLRSSEEKALKVILHAEQSRRIYNSIRELLEKKNKPLTQIDVSSSSDPLCIDTLNTKLEIEQCLLSRNRNHSLQLSNSISPNCSQARFDDFLSGKFLDSDVDTSTLHPTAVEWIRSLKTMVSQEISLSLSIEDFKCFFKAKQEKTASSPSGRHMGHYKVILECIRRDNLILPALILTITHLSLITATPLQQWTTASQVMIEKGKGCHIDHSRIIQ